MVLLGDDSLVDARFSPFGDSANVDVCAEETTGSKIALDTPDRTPR